MDHLWGLSIVPLPDRITQETPAAESEPRTQEPATLQRGPEKLKSIPTRKPTPAARKSRSQRVHTPSTRVTRSQSARIAAGKSTKQVFNGTPPQESIALEETTTSTASRPRSTRVAARLAMLNINETSPRPAKTQENASTPITSPESSATQIVKLKIDKAILQQFQVAEITSTSSPSETYNDVGDRQSGEVEGLRQSKAHEQESSTSQKRAATDAGSQSSGSTKKCKAMPFLTIEQEQKIREQILSRAALIAKEPRPFTDYISEYESRIEFGKDIIAIFAHDNSTQQLVAGVTEALQSYSIRPKTATSVSSRGAVTNGAKLHSDPQENSQAANGMSKIQIHPTTWQELSQKRALSSPEHESSAPVKWLRPNDFKQDDEGADPEENEVTTSKENEVVDAAQDKGTNSTKCPEELFMHTKAKDMTEMEFDIAINAVRIRFLETLSLETMKSLFVDEEGDMILNPIRHKKRTEKSRKWEEGALRQPENLEESMDMGIEAVICLER